MIWQSCQEGAGGGVLDTALGSGVALWGLRSRWDSQVGGNGTPGLCRPSQAAWEDYQGHGQA